MEYTMKNGCDVLLIGYEDQENLGLRSIAAFLTEHGVQVKIEPYHHSLKEDILARIRTENPVIVGFSLIFQRMFFDFADLITYLRQNGVTAHFTMGGHFPTLEYKKTLELMPGLNTVVRHEGEQTLLELFNYIGKPDYWHQIKGIAYRKDGKIIVNHPRPLIQNLNSLPYPLRSDQFATHRGLRSCSILASRGCYYNCSFCSIHQFYREPPGPMRRSRSPYNVAQEMEQLFSEHKVCIFSFKDDDLSTKGHQQRQWIEDFIKELKKRKIGDKILWRISSRVDEVESELVKKLKEVGLLCLYLGIESGSNQGLKTFNKQYSVDDVYKAIGILKKLKMPFEYGFMLFEPNSTLASIKENIDFFKEIGKDGEVVVHFTKTFPYAGTPIAHKLKEEGRITGTIASPDYDYKDPRLDLIQSFFSQTFNFRNFDKRGLVNLSQLAKFDAIVLDRFFQDKYDTQEYIETVKELTRQSNVSALETMGIAVNFMENRTYEEIIDNWHVLQCMAQKERDIELRISAELNQLMYSYDLETIG